MVTTTTELLPPNVPAPPKIAPENDSSGSDNLSHGLKSQWPVALDLAGSNLPCRLEGEVENLVCPLLLSCSLFITGSFVAGRTRRDSQGDRWLLLPSNGRSICTTASRQCPHRWRRQYFCLSISRWQGRSQDALHRYREAQVGAKGEQGDVWTLSKPVHPPSLRSVGRNVNIKLDP